MLSAYIKHHSGLAPTINQHLAAISILHNNSEVEGQGPKHWVKIVKMSVLIDKEMRQLSDLIATLIWWVFKSVKSLSSYFFDFARLETMLGIKVGDYCI